MIPSSPCPRSSMSCASLSLENTLSRACNPSQKPMRLTSLFWNLLLLFGVSWPMVIAILGATIMLGSPKHPDPAGMLFCLLCAIWGGYGIRFFRRLTWAVTFDPHSKNLILSSGRRVSVDGREVVCLESLQRISWVEISVRSEDTIRFLPCLTVYSDIQRLGAQVWWKTLVGV